MISYSDGVFHLAVADTSYIFRLSPQGQLEHIYYGGSRDAGDVDALVRPRDIQTGSTVAYAGGDPAYSLDTMCLEWSTPGRGDYRLPAAEIKMPDGSFNADFVYCGHEITDGVCSPHTLPGAVAEKGAQTLRVDMRDESNAVALALYYTVFYDCGVMTRRAVLTNSGAAPLNIRRIMSMSLDMPAREFELVTLDGGWIKEANVHRRALAPGIYVNSSVTGNSSNRHNPGFMLCERGASEDSGAVYGFNLIYSGNHYGACELSPDDLLRVQCGINPLGFEWALAPGESFETPEAVLGWSGKGFGGLSRSFADFVNEHIVRGDWKGRERPVLFNNWEACFFKFTRRRLLKLARRAHKLGAELFVLDDGWFAGRNSDTAGLGDYAVDRRKLPFGLGELAGRVKKMGMMFGLWFEPEMVNPDSELYRAHPEWAVTTPGKKPSLGRNQLVLDLCRAEVRDYIVENVGRVLDEAGVDYVKWDMNRHISDAYSPALAEQGEFYHRYVLGLYEVLERIFRPRPQILLESCASGGNRFDLGMLCYSPQIWTSDDTDPSERLRIQSGISHLYPLSAMGAHVSAAPHQQTLRDTPLSDRYNVACFGLLGYELDLRWLTPVEKKEIKRQIDFYKQHRRTLQYGEFYRIDAARGNRAHWLCVAADGSEAIAGFFQTQARAADSGDYLPLRGLEPKARYSIETVPYRLYIHSFGALVKHILPVELAPGGTVLRFADRHFALDGAVMRREASGRALLDGLPLPQQFIGTGYNEKIRLLGDNGSELYLIKKIG